MSAADRSPHPDVMRAALALIDRADMMSELEDINEPHIAMAYDPEVGATNPLLGIAHVRGPYPSAPEAMAAAIAWCASLNATNGADDPPWKPGIARLWEPQ